MDSCLRIDLCFHNIHACVVPSHKRICGRESLIPAFMWESWEYCGCVCDLLLLLHYFVSENVVSVTLSGLVITSEAFLLLL